MRTFKVAAIVVLAVVAAALSTIASTELVLEDVDPELVARLPLPDGFAQAEVARQLVARSIRPGSLLQLDWPKNRPQKVMTLSLDAYRREPLASAALANLGLVAESEGNAERARLLMRDAGRLTRRNLITNIWLMTDYTRREELGPALASLDNALRSSDDARPSLIQVLVENLSHAELLQPVAQMLQSDPPWANDFWHEAYHVPSALPNAARLRVLVQHSGVRVPEQYDRGLLEELTKNHLYREAEQVFDAVSGDDRKGGEILRNAAFASTPRYKPFDWELFFGDSLTADLLPSAGQLVISTFSGGNGAAARQLVDLAPGKYALQFNFADRHRIGSRPLNASLICAEDTVSPDRQVFQPDSSGVKAMATVADNCRYFWLELDVLPQDNGASNTIALDSVSLKKV